MVGSNVRIQFQIEKSVDAFKFFTGNKSSFVVDIEGFYCRIIRVADNGNLTNNGKNDSNIRDAKGDDYHPGDLRHIRINCRNPQELLKLICLLEYKNSIKHISKVWSAWIDDYNYNDAVAFDPNDSTTFLEIDPTDDTLTLDTTKFVNGLDGLKINDPDFTAANGVDRVVGSADDTDNTRRDEILGKREAIDFFEKMGSFWERFPDPYEDNQLRDFSSIQQSEVDFLRRYGDETNTNDIKYKICNYDSLILGIEETISWLEEMLVWKGMGYTKEEEVIRANANGYFIVKRQGSAFGITMGETDTAGNLTGKAGHLNSQDGGDGQTNVAY